MPSSSAMRLVLRMPEDWPSTTPLVAGELTLLPDHLRGWIERELGAGAAVDWRRTIARPTARRRPIQAGPCGSSRRSSSMVRSSRADEPGRRERLRAEDRRGPVAAADVSDPPA